MLWTKDGNLYEPNDIQQYEKNERNALQKNFYKLAGL